MDADAVYEYGPDLYIRILLWTNSCQRHRGHSCFHLLYPCVQARVSKEQEQGPKVGVVIPFLLNTTIIILIISIIMSSINTAVIINGIFIIIKMILMAIVTITIDNVIISMVVVSNEKSLLR